MAALSPLAGPAIDILQPLALALAQGFLVGVERGWRRRDAEAGSRAAGLRTFALAGLFGGLSGLIGQVAGPVAMSAMLLAFAAVFLAFQLRESAADHDFSATSAVAGLITAVLGALTFTVPAGVIAAVAVAHVTLLAFREPLHLLLQRLTWPEVRSAVLLLAMTFIIAPLLPARPIDPWGAIALRQLWWMTVLIGAASFAGYVALRALPTAAGLTLSALVGAVVSSTAVTLDLARRAAAGEAPQQLAVASAFAASAVMALRMGVIVAVVAGGALATAGPPLAAAFVVSASLAVILGRTKDKESEPPKLGSPLDLMTVARFGLILAVLTATARLIGAFWGPRAFLPFAAAAGFADPDAAILAIGQTPGIAPALAGDAILLAAAAAMSLKMVVAFTAGRAAFGRAYLLGSLAAVAAAGATWGAMQAMGWP
jgi:uncharacterized membrane protein (DUF4010 family)